MILNKTAKIHCLFEQSGTFRDVFREVGFEAYDYDIEDLFGKTDFRLDLFEQISNDWHNIRNGKSSRHTIFDDMCGEDLLFIFFPCTYFTGSTNPMFMNLTSIQQRNKSTVDKFTYAIRRAESREYYYKMLYMLFGIIHVMGLRAILENPWKGTSFLKNNFLKAPDIIHWNRAKHGDMFVKPTAYWFFNCQPSRNETNVIRRQTLKVNSISRCGSSKRAMISRSLIAPDYARNFIYDYILDMNHPGQQTVAF